MSSPLVLPFSSIDLSMLPLVGGKNAALGELGRLAAEGVAVPDGFALTTAAFRRHLGEAGQQSTCDQRLGRLDVSDGAAVARVSAELRAAVAAAPLPAVVAEAARQAYERLSAACGEAETDVAVRSSATAEDLPAASFAGMQESFLNVRGWPALDRAVRACMASLFTERALVYRAHLGLLPCDVTLSVGVQKMVRSDLGASGVAFTLDPESGFRDVVLVSGAFGLGEAVVQGRLNPDEWCVHKPGLRAGLRPIVRRRIGDKSLRVVYADGTGASTRDVPVEGADRLRPSLEDDDVLRLARWALTIEDHWSTLRGAPTPMDIEWARDGRDGRLYIVQARPETVHSRRATRRIELHRLTGEGEVLLRGRAVGARIGAGPVRIVRGAEELRAFRDGEVIVAATTNPDWDTIMRRAAAVITDKGGRTCHAAIVARELGIPCVVGTGDATRELRDGQVVTVSCAHGEEGRVFAGRVAFEREEIDPATLPVPRVPLMLNLADPDQAFALAALPSAGVGLLRIEFLISRRLGVHPLALVHPERVTDAAQRRAIAERVGGGDGPRWFVEGLALGVAQIAAAFWPRPVILRFSDFKTDEYAGLLGGADFEPQEANPMIGWRGASRYHDPRYSEGFALECAAVRRVREDMGLTNLQLMIPFCRTLREGREVLAEMERHGLRRGEHGLQVWVMCEIPNNVILAEGFGELFDGFSIGSNDLTQLTLGVDRNSELLASVFDERDPGVRTLIRQVVAAAHRRGRKVGLCGEAPSNDPAYAAWLADIGIDSISLNPDALARVARALAQPRAVPAASVPKGAPVQELALARRVPPGALIGSWP